MAKKGSWFSAIKRMFTPHSKEKLANELEKKRTKHNTKIKTGKKKGWHGDNTSFLQLFKEPSSIEKILDEAERDHNLIFQPPTPQEQPNTPSFVSPRPASPRIPSPRVSSPRATSSRREPGYRPEPTLRYRNDVVTKIQAAYRGYAARKSFRALKGLVRLQSVIRGHSVQKQTANAMKQMQLLVRVQSQIRLRRIQMLEHQMRNQPYYQNDKHVDTTTFMKWTMSQTAEASNNQDWDDSLLTKEEVDERLRRKAEATAKREKAMAYAYSNQSWRPSPKSTENPLAGVRSGGYPLWWNWIEHHLPTTRENANNFKLTPPRAKSELKPTPRPGSSSSTNKKHQFGLDNSTPRSAKSTIIPSTRQMRTPPSYRFSQNLPMKDDDSLTSCPPFSAPSYMGVTVSAKAKVKAGGSGMMDTSESSSRRASFPLSGGGGGMGSFKWNKFFGKDSSPSTSTASRIFDKNHYSVQSVGNMSVDSTASMPVGIGRKPFNRFV